jgi:hypothetical protein
MYVPILKLDLVTGVVAVLAVATASMSTVTSEIRNSWR